MIILTVAFTAKILILIISSLIIRQSIILSGQIWINTFAHTTTLLLLPIITFVITSVISGNIALSLGMVGALSIIRFRNPVKSPLELVIYFLMITLGIAASVDINWVILLALSTFLIIFSIFVITSLYLKIKKKPLLTTSFSEGNSLNTIEISSNQSIETLESSPYLINYLFHPETYTYRLAHSNKETLLSIKREIEESHKNNIIHIKYTIA